MIGAIQGYLASGGALNILCAFLLAFALVAYGVFALQLTRIDFQQHRLPNRLVFPLYAWLGLPLLLVAFLEGRPHQALQSLLSGLALFLAYWALRKLSRNGLGFGDVKLAGILGLAMGFFSPLNLFWGTLLTFLTAGLVSTLLIILRRANPKSRIALGPYMLLGTTIALLFPVTTL